MRTFREYSTNERIGEDINYTIKKAIIHELCTEGGIFLRNEEKLAKNKKLNSVKMVKDPTKAIFEIIDIVGQDEIDHSDMWKETYAPYRGEK